MRIPVRPATIVHAHAYDIIKMGMYTVNIASRVYGPDVHGGIQTRILFVARNSSSLTLLEYSRAGSDPCIGLLRPEFILLTSGAVASLCMCKPFLASPRRQYLLRDFFLMAISFLDWRILEIVL